MLALVVMNEGKRAPFSTSNFDLNNVPSTSAGMEANMFDKLGKSYEEYSNPEYGICLSLIESNALLP